MKIFYKVENLRSIRDMDYIELKPITILVGKNNSGKSTLLRTFQLLRQSIESHSSAPILWKGVHSDFGDFSSAITDCKADKEICFCFKIEKLMLRLNSSPNEIKSLEYKTFIGMHEKRTTLRKIEFHIADIDLKVEISFTKNGIDINSLNINGVDVLKQRELLENSEIVVDCDEIFPSFNVLQNNYDEYREKYRSIFKKMIFDNLYRIISNFNLKNKNSMEADLMQKIADDFLHHPNISQKYLRGKIGTNGEKNAMEFYTSLMGNAALIEQINMFCAMFWTFAALNGASNVLRKFFVENIYIGPERVNSSRFYEVQEIDITNISPNGQNFPMFLNSLDKDELQNFSRWIESLLNIKLNINKVGDIFSINFSRNDIYNVSYSDSGYGLTQILPILAQFWITSRKCKEYVANSRKDDSSAVSLELQPITIEQPEVHLHPTHQEKIADALAMASDGMSSTYCPIFIVETHSKKIIDRLAVLISNGTIDRNNVNIVLFSTSEDIYSFRENSDQDEMYSHVSESYFNQENVLENWPYGFLR